MMRWMFLAVVLVVMVAGGAFYFLAGNLNRIVRERIEAQGSAALGTPVRVGSVELDLREGRGRLLDLRVENPPDFAGGDVLSLGSITLVIDAKSALAVASGRSRHLIVDEVSVEAPRADVVLREDGSSNLQALQRGISSRPRSPAATGAESAPLLLTLKRVSMASVEVRADTRALDGKRHELELPDFSMGEVGGAGGSPAGEVGASLARSFATRLAKHVAARAAVHQLDRAIDAHLGGAAGEAAKGLLGKVLGGS